jgi:hypothetical protein
MGMHMAPSINSLLRRVSIGLVVPGLVFLSVTRCCVAQDENRYTFHGGGGAGVTPLVGDISSRLDNGWHITFGGGVNLTSHFATTLDYGYNGFGVSRKVLNEAQVPDGNAHLQSITVNPKFRLVRIGKVMPYVVGGVGYYRRTVEFTRPALVSVFIFDPFFGDLFNTLVPANQVLGRITEDGVGGSLGAGFALKFGESRVKFFTEARYHYADTGNVPTRMVPVTFGFRW